MKKIISALILVGFLLSGSSFANDMCTVIGFHEPNTNTYDGPTYCEQVNINGIIVRGPLQIDQSAITSTTDVSGPIQASKTNFDSIVIENDYSHQTVSLKKNSVVKNNIVFEGSDRGTVIIDKSSSIKGKVINGDVQHSAA